MVSRIFAKRFVMTDLLRRQIADSVRSPFSNEAYPGEFHGQVHPPRLRHPHRRQQRRPLGRDAGRARLRQGQARRRLRRDRQTPRRNHRAAAGMDPPALDRGREHRHDRGRRAHEEARPRRGLPESRNHPHERPPGRLRDARRRREGNPRALFHVRREAGRPERMELAALGRQARRAARPRHDPRSAAARPTRKARRPRSSPPCTRSAAPAASSRSTSSSSRKARRRSARRTSRKP